MMGNYKIRVNNEAESKEAQDLFFELGYAKSKQCQWLVASCIQFLATEGEYLHCWDEENFGGNRFDSLTHKELTLPQLRDLVVLKRNDVKDATHFQTIEPESKFFVTSNQTVYFFDDDDAWVLSGIRLSELTPITQPQDPALISGADALRALADGINAKDIEGKFSDGFSERFITMEDKVHIFVKYLNEKLFRLKPQTIKLELELPKPFKPRDGDDCFIVDSEQEDGFYRFTYSEDSGFHQNFIQFGVYKTEEDVKKAVEQLRKIKGAV